ncbi:MAG: hypothetical protein JEY79_05125 [Pseudodesulfovibrio sp.]|nr:hypothetical protein [Pseudodesulfovibrio sp.]
MMIPTVALGIGILAFLFLYQVISRNKVSKMNSLAMQKQNAQSKYEFMLNHKRELKKELEEKKRKLATLRNNQQGIKTISSDDLEIKDIDDNEKVSRYLIQHGKITMEQNIKVLKKWKYCRWTTSASASQWDSSTSKPPNKPSRSTRFIQNPRRSTRPLPYCSNKEPHRFLDAALSISEF